MSRRKHHEEDGEHAPMLGEELPGRPPGVAYATGCGVTRYAGKPWDVTRLTVQETGQRYCKLHRWVRSSSNSSCTYEAVYMSDDNHSS